MPLFPPLYQLDEEDPAPPPAPLVPPSSSPPPAAPVVVAGGVVVALGDPNLLAGPSGTGVPGAPGGAFGIGVSGRRPTAVGSVAPVSRFGGAGYPFGPTPDAVFGQKPDEAVVLSSVLNILSTPKGSVPYNPSLGSVLPYLVFEINDEITRALLRHYVVKDLAEQEPRVVVRGVLAELPDDYTIIVTVALSIVGDPSGHVFNAPVIFASEG